MERLGLDPGSKGVPQYGREHEREILNKRLRKINPGVKFQHKSMEPRKECGGYWNGSRLRSQGLRGRRWQWKRKGRDASKRHLEEKVGMMALCYESVEERESWRKKQIIHNLPFSICNLNPYKCLFGSSRRYFLHHRGLQPWARVHHFGDGVQVGFQPPGLLGLATV